MVLFVLSKLGQPGVRWSILTGLMVALMGCGVPKPTASQANAQQAQQGPATVNVAVARTGTVQEALEYTGTTQPFREVSLRSQVAAQLLDLPVDVGDRVTQGQTVAQLDGAVQTASVAEAQAEVAALQAEVVDAQVQVADAQTQVNRARSELQQARADAARLRSLAEEGVVPQQQAEQAETAAETAAETLRSAQEQVRSRQQRITAAQQRVAAQRAVVTQQQQQQAFTVLTSPVTGAVLARTSEPGNLVQAGNEVLRLGDFSQVKVAVQVSELELGNIRQGQGVTVRLDAFPGQTFNGRVSRISPAADPVGRLIPIEITIPNPNGRIGSGLLARVTFNQRTNRSRILVLETALEANQERRGGQSGGGNRPSGGDRPSGSANRNSAASGNPANSQQPDNASPSGRSNLPRDIGTVFVITGSDDKATVLARQVTLGRRGEGQVEIISGLQVGDRYVSRSSKALKNGDPVRLSILSEQK